MIQANEQEFYSILRSDQIAFTEKVFKTVSPAHEYHDNWHIHCIIEYLQAVERGQIRRLIINMPPRSLKSICVSIAWTAWLLGHNPKNQIMVASFVQDLAKAHSIDTRLIIESDWYRTIFPNTIIAYDQNEKTKFKTTEQGFRMAYSVGASRIGQGGDYLILDDPVNPEDALSNVKRISTNNWIGQSFLTRENDPKISKAVLVMQRLHEEDPTGFLLESKQWEHLVLPAKFEKKTIIEINNRKWCCEENAYLHADRMGEDELQVKLTELGLQAFTGQYQQRPQAIGGGEFQEQYVQHYDNFDKRFSAQGMNVYILMDSANSKKKDSDFTTMMVWGLSHDQNYYLLDAIRDRLNPTERVTKLIMLHKKWNKKSGKPPKVGCEQYGMMADAYFIRKAQEDINYRFQLIELGGKLNKEDRIRKLIPLWETKRIFLPKLIAYKPMDPKAPVIELVQELIKNELLVFPVGKYDDMIDATARLLDKELNTVFPEDQTLYLEAGQSIHDLYGTNDDWMDF